MRDPELFAKFTGNQDLFAFPGTTGRKFCASACRIYLLILVISAGLSQAWAQPAISDVPKKYSFPKIRMGVPWEIQIYTNDPRAALEAAESAYDRVKQLDRMMSDYDPDSKIRQLCDRAQPGQFQPLSDELREVLQFSQALSQQTGGAFDVTVGPVTDLWRKAWRKQELPEEKQLSDVLDRVGYQKMKLCPQRGIRFDVPGMRVDLGAIAKGYAADEAAKVLQEAGFDSFLIDGSGDIVVGEAPPGTSGWKVEIEPLHEKTTGKQPTDQPPLVLNLKNRSVATSGDANRYVEIDGVRYSHIVNPKTGIGLTVSSSVTVIAKNGMIADALASAVSVLGPDEGLKLLEEYGAEGLVVYAQEKDSTLQRQASPKFSECLLPRE